MYELADPNFLCLRHASAVMYTVMNIDPGYGFEPLAHRRPRPVTIGNCCGVQKKNPLRLSKAFT